MEVDFTQYIIIRHHGKVTGLILMEHGEEHAPGVKKRFWDILSLRKEQGSALNPTGSASGHAQGDMNKVLGYFVTNKSGRFVRPKFEHMLVLVPHSGCKVYLNVTLALESHFMSYRYLYQEIDIDNAGPVWVYIWTPESFSVAFTCTMAFQQGGDLQ